MQVLTILLFCIVIGVSCSRHARTRGRNPQLWFWIGFIFGILGLIALFLLPSLAIQKKRSSVKLRPLPEIPSLLKAKDPTHAQKLWYYLDQEQNQLGPMSLNALTQAWETKKIDKSTYIWNELMDNWQTCEETFHLSSPNPV